MPAAAARDVNIDIDPDRLPEPFSPNMPLSLYHLYTVLRSLRCVQAICDWVAPHMEPGSVGRTAVDRTGLFNVNQYAVEIPMDLPGLSTKYGMQVNIVKPNISPNTSNYYLQIFPAHDEIGFNLEKMFNPAGIDKLLPDWCGVSAQIIRNHGFNIPIVNKDGNWQLDLSDELEYLEEWVIRPAELDLKYLGTPAQSTIGLELGMHFKWNVNNPNAKWAFALSTVANIIGASVGAVTVGAVGGNPMLLVHGASMIGQLTAHGMQCRSATLCPDTVLTWAGATFSPGDLNLATSSMGRVTEYPRIWFHVYDGCWKFRDLRRQAEAAVAPIIERNRQDQAIELAELGIDNPGFRSGTRLSTISENYAAQQ